MGNQYNFLQAGLDETIYKVPDNAKVIISQNKINSQNDVNSFNDTLIIYQPFKGEDLSPDIQETLNKIIASVKLGVNETRSLNLNKLNGTHFQQLTKNHSIKYLICFGVLPIQMGIHITTQQYEFTSIGNIQMIFADHLENLNKNLLWKKLQMMYQLKG